MMHRAPSAALALPLAATACHDKSTGKNTNEAARLTIDTVTALFDGSDDFEAMRDDLTPGVDCIAVPMADPSQTALALERLARDPSQLGALGRAARTTYEARFSPQVVRDRFDALLGNRLGFRAPQRLPMRTEARVLVPTS